LEGGLASVARSRTEQPARPHTTGREDALLRRSVLPKMTVKAYSRPARVPRGGARLAGHDATD